MLAEEEARARTLNNVQALPLRNVALANALDCFAAKDYFAQSPLPNFDNSAMDGYAVIASSCRRGERLRITDEQPAGLDRRLHVSAGEAVRIFTGAPLPAGADAVVMQEDVTAAGAEIIVNTAVEQGEFVRRRGCDVSEGQKILSTGERIRSVNLAVLASQGFAEVIVGGQVNAAVVSTGDELAPLGEELRDGQIYDSNSVLLRGLLQSCGVTVGSVEHCRDDRDALARTLEKGLQNSVLIISGGVSVGEHDLVKSTLHSLGAQIDIWRVAIKPGKPFLFGRAGRCAVFGLPGNPVSSFVTFLKFVRPAILKMMGAADHQLQLRTIPARLMQDALGDRDRPHYIRGKLFQGEFTPVGRQESHALFGLSQSSALLRVAPGSALKAGTLVDVEIWD